jgi:hypothetical protein
MSMPFVPIRYGWYKNAPTQLDLNPDNGELSVIVADAFDYERLNEFFFYIEAADSDGNAGARRSTAVLRLVIEASALY